MSEIENNVNEAVSNGEASEAPKAAPKADKASGDILKLLTDKKVLIPGIAGILVIAIVILAVAGVFTPKGNGPQGDNNTPGTTKTYYNNASDPLVFSTLEVDKVFNPFYSTSATDSNVVGMTQIGMLANDKDGNYTFGDHEAVVVKDLQIVTEGTQNVDKTTTYYFVLKNNIKFSNGSPLTIKDVLFNLYVYLDPAYTGSATLYSTDIVGLAEYRTQAATEVEQEAANTKFEVEAKTRRDTLIQVASDILKDNNGISTEDLRAKLVESTEIFTGVDAYAHLAEDFDKTLALFREELESDYSNSLNSYADTKLYDKVNNEYKPFHSDAAFFLYNEGFINWNKKDAKLEYACGEKFVTDLEKLSAEEAKEKAIEYVYNAMVPDSIDEILMYWATSSNLFDYIAKDAMEKAYKGQDKQYKNISGIRFANREAPVTVNGVEYAVPTYAQDGSVTSGNEVLSIKIKDVDPKAIWNFSFAVAPMYYYSSENYKGKNYIAAFDYESNFGVEYASQSFMTDVIKDPAKVGVPVGAGAYAASKMSGGIDNVSSGDFYRQGMIYFEANPYFAAPVTGKPALIKKLRFRVVSSTQMLNSLYNHEIDFAEPNAKKETEDELKAKVSDGIGSKSIQTAGYGYIGINAGKVAEMKVRQAIMHSINTQECVDYYKSSAEAIYRSMSLSSWAYPNDSTPYYPYIGGKIPANLDVVNPDYKAFVLKKGKTAGQTFTEEEQIEFISGLLEEAGYRGSAEGGWSKSGVAKPLTYTFTVAGEETDHPAWNAMYKAGLFLNKCGFNINVTTDANALKKLSTGDLTVWAAAWGSTIDPDMYQVYHKDSTASSVLNWGYKQILQNIGGKYDAENKLLGDLSELIDLARKTEDKSERAGYYSRALDIVMQLAIELPTYQRNDLFAYNTDKIDTSTFNTDLSAFKGLTGDLHLLSLNEEQ